jgi:hypothetical protein
MRVSSRLQAIAGVLTAVFSPTWSTGCSQIDAQMPAGYPAVTEAGRIEVKTYPATRTAVHTKEADFDRGLNDSFWPLFNHIKDRRIEMTAPVISDYPADVAPTVRSGRMSVAFVYPSPATGTPGAAGRVEVVDVPPMTVVSIGVKGSYTMSTMLPALKKLEAWLKTEGREWVAEGQPRRLFYNNPMWRPGWTLNSEVQIPIRKAG